MRKVKNQLRSGIYLSYINLAISSLIPFVYTPVMLRILGQAEYGLYSLSNSVVGYLSLLSFGFGGTIVRYLAKYRAEGKTEEVEKSYGFFIILYSLLALAVMVGGIIISNNVESIFDQGLFPNEIQKMRILILIMAFNVAMSFPLSVFSSVAIAHERYFFRKIMDIVSTIAAPVANLIALYLGYASIGMALAGTVVQFLMAPISMLYCAKVLKIKPKFQKMPGSLIREMLGFSAFVFIGSLVDMLFWATDKVILGMLASSTAVAIYNVGGTFNNMVMSVSTSISSVFTPRVTGMVVTNQSKEELSSLMIRIGRIQFLIVALVVSGFTVFGETFINLWAGSEYADAYWITVLTLFPMCIPLIQNIAKSIITAQNKHQFRAIVYLIIAIINVVSTYLVVPYAGIIGAAFCSCVSYLLGQGLIMNLYYHKVTGLNIPLFWKNILKMSVTPAVMLVIGLMLKRVVVIEDWFSFFASVVVYTGVYGILMYLFAMNQYEKDLIRKPLEKIFKFLFNKQK